MEKPRLVAFGCSYTHGHTLPDCPYPENPPSISAWPKKLAKLINPQPQKQKKLLPKKLLPKKLPLKK